MDRTEIAKRVLSVVIAACIASLPTAALCQQPTRGAAREARDGERTMSRPSADLLGQLSDSLQELARRVSPAVVQIEVSGFGPAIGQDPGTPLSIVRRQSTAAGVIVDPDGYIVTNAHVVEGAHRVRVLLSLLGPTAPTDESLEGRFRVLDARVIGSERQTDIALLKVEASGLPTLPFDLDRPPQPGELVFAIGSPSGLRNSVTMGVISSAWRQPDPDDPMVYVQTDAPINPGNSGGPLVDVTGAVVGLNTFIMSTGGGDEGLGFAIPAPVVNFVYQGLRKHGRVDHVEIGVLAQTVTPTLADGLGLAQDWGVVISDVLPFGPAATAGMLPGDIVAAVDGHPTPNLPWFAAALFRHPPDEALSIELLRGSERRSLSVTGVVPRDPTDQLVELADPRESHVERLGIVGLDLDDQLLPLLPAVRLPRGVIVLGQAPGFGSVDVGLRAGDVIHSLNRTPIESVEQLTAVVAGLASGDAAVLRIERRGQFQFLAFEMD